MLHCQLLAGVLPQWLPDIIESIMVPARMRELNGNKPDRAVINQSFRKIGANET